jgi:hypothetical protein
MMMTQFAMWSSHAVERKKEEGLPPFYSLDSTIYTVYSTVQSVFLNLKV